ARSAAKILFTGAVPNSALSEHYHSCDLYAATADRTNLSQSVLEALCYGVPVVALNTGRTADLIRDGVNGRLVEPGDSRGLREVIAQILADGELLGRLSRGALATAAETIPEVEERIAAEADLFQSLTAGKRGKD
ncbi:MAG TPA: glycosyltransferase, partial [Candidatus Glassbacteria bacterium]|nr:glycosyltransferase [Candidatus Glassbacteria bacterium]